MAAELYTIKNKIQGISYAFTLNGIELPVLDVTHPDFLSYTNEKILNKLFPYVQKNAEKNAEKLNKIPGFYKRYLINHSFATAELLKPEGQNEFASGITTIMMKLGPKLLGKGKKRFWDRQMNRGFGPLVIRMRARDISKCQAEVLIPLLRQSNAKGLCFINIAGGAASDNINALFLIQNESPELLKGRKIEINVLDIDNFGPAFAERSITALKEPGGRFNGMGITFRHIYYNWNETEKLEELLSERKEWLQLCSSEGGLFEYCTDEVISRNLNVLCDLSNEEIIIAGTLLLDAESIDAGMLAALKISTNIKPRLLGISGLKTVTKESRWNIEKVIGDNPRYLVFALGKKKV
jgi:hypothetical protein